MVCINPILPRRATLIQMIPMIQVFVEKRIRVMPFFVSPRFH